jgi:phosphate transport system protein
LNAVAGGDAFGHFHTGVRKMVRFATAMLRDALDCFDRVDVVGAAAVAARDPELDAEFQFALRDLMSYVIEDARHMRGTMHAVFVLKALERVGDLASAIAAETRRLVGPHEADAASVAVGSG